MRLTALLGMAAEDVAQARGRNAVSALGIALGVAVLMIVAGLGLGVRDVVLGKVVEELPIDTVEVVPKTLDLGLFKVGTRGLFGAAEIDDETLEKLRGLPGVRAAHPKLEVKLPLGAQGGTGLFGRRLYTDLFITGLPPELVVDEVGEAFRDRSDFVPVIISNQLIEIYNSSVATTLGTPGLTAETLTGFEFELVIGRSLMLGSRGAKSVGVERARIVGVSRYAMQLGATVPLETARRLMAKYGEPGPDSYRSILVTAKSAADVPEVTQAVRGLGLAVDETAQRTSDLLLATTALATLFGLLVLTLAGMNIAHSFFAMLSERRRELAILRALGATRGDLVGLVLAQAALVSLLGGVLGALSARLLAPLLDLAAATLLPAFPFKPDSFFVMPVGLDLGALACAVVAALFGALLPALRAARGSLSRALAEL